MINGMQVLSQGYWWPVVAGDTVALGAGDVLRINVQVPYKGPAEQYTLYASIGQRKTVIGFNEILVGRAPLDCPDSPHTFTVVEGNVDIQVVMAGFLGTGGISPGTGYDLYVKIEENPGVADEINGVIDIVETAAPDMSGMVMMMFPLLMLGMVAPMTEGMEE